jgi:ABC-type nitrate/sulfonate/bicarbonate transport system substrate-binding protein
MAVREQDLPEKYQVSSIWYTRCPVPTTSGLAQHFGWIRRAFQREGIQVQSLQDTSDPRLRRSHFTHSLLASFREGGNIPAIWAKAQGQDTAVVGISWVDEEQLVLVRPDSNIRSLADLKGCKLGIPKNHAQVVISHVLRICMGSSRRSSWPGCLHPTSRSSTLQGMTSKSAGPTARDASPAR